VRPVSTIRTTGIYGAPKGTERVVGGLPYYRERDAELDTTIVWSDWQFEENELRVLAEGGHLCIGIVGLEPIPPIAVRVLSADRDTSED
jgi:hypothetical protein